jgi:hypothetical protein
MADNPTPNGTAQLAVGIGASIIGILVVEGSKRLANAIVGDPHEIESQKYEEMHRRLEGKHYHIPMAEDLVSPARVTPVRRQPVARLAVKEAGSPVMEHVRETLRHLDAAMVSTTCGVCQKELKAAKAVVEERSAIIMRADQKQQVMRQLKDAGKIPQNVRWDMLNPKQKKFINEVVERSIKNGY